MIKISNKHGLLAHSSKVKSEIKIKRKEKRIEEFKKKRKGKVRLVWTCVCMGSCILGKDLPEAAMRGKFRKKL